MDITSESVQANLNSNDFDRRIRGINQLRLLDQDVAFTMVQPLVQDSNARIRYAAVSLFDVLGSQDLATSLEILRDRLFNDPEVDVKAAAADAIGGLKLQEAFPDLEQVYHQTSDWLIQMSIVATLGELGHPKSFDLLSDALSSSNELIVSAAVSSLGELGDLRALPLLVPMINHPDWQVRYRLTHSIHSLGGSEAVKALKSLADDSHEEISQTAKKYLAGIKT